MSILTGASAAREQMPKMSEVARAWSEMPDHEIADLFPDLRSLAIDWGEPFCFRCGWLTPTRESAEYPANWSAQRSIDHAWDAASGWLERGHLHDHEFGGDESAKNLVPLCVLCHEKQPQCENREAGIAFVNERADNASIVWLIQQVTDRRYRGKGKPGHAAALRRMLRAQAEVAVALAREIA